MRAVMETGEPTVVETVVESRAGPIGPLQRQPETELKRYAEIAAHDLREPVLAIGMFVEQLAARLERGRDERNAGLVDLIRRADARGKTLIDGILEHARYGVVAESEPVDTDVIVSDVLDSLSAALDAAGASVEVGELPSLEGNAAQLSRVFQNLVANSLKFSSAEPRRVSIAAERADGFWVFTVADNEGCGIGLAVCRKIVEAHGGAISAAPAPGGGTCIRFSLPAADAPAPSGGV
jgi:light-regulated signal transduction histidine kinase (bacteriophytochrome)